MQIYRRVVPNQEKKNRGEHIQTHLSAAVSSLEVPTVAVVGTLVHLGDFPPKKVELPSSKSFGMCTTGSGSQL
jgi:hypothetical protein